MRLDLSIIVPTVNIGKWKNVYDSIEDAVSPYTYEVIFVGPYVKEIPAFDDVKTIVDYGCPSRCVQIASLVASGRYMTWGSDDGTYVPGTLKECVELLDKAGRGHEWQNNHDEVTVQYIEGLNNDPTLFQDVGNPHYKGPHPGLDLGYWHAHFHESLRLGGIDVSTRIAPLGMLSTQLFKDLGGFDCRMQHINMSCIDLSLRLQEWGGNLLVSPNPVLLCDFDPNNHKVWGAYHEVDYPYFKSLYETRESANKRRAGMNHRHFHNWMDAEPFWSRRWEVKKL